MINDPLQRLLDKDPHLKPYKEIIRRRLTSIHETQKHLTRGEMRLSDFSSGHEYFGLHLSGNEWVFREWAPNATAIYLVGEMSGWQEQKGFALDPIGEEGVWEIRLPSERLEHKDLYRLRVHWQGGEGDRIPAYARRVVQDPDTMIFNAQVWLPPDPYKWGHNDYRCPAGPLLIYEVHVGMAQEEEKIGYVHESILAAFCEVTVARVADTVHVIVRLTARARVSWRIFPQRWMRSIPANSRMASTPLRADGALPLARLRPSACMPAITFHNLLSRRKCRTKSFCP